MRPGIIAPQRSKGADISRLGASLTELVGNTPVVKLSKVVPVGAADVFVKLEWFNPTGSYKDRMALAIIEEAERRGDLKPGMTVVEYTGGSTGSSLAFVCAVKGYRFKVVSSDAFSKEKLRTMRALGAELEILPSEGGVITPDLVPRMVDRAREIAQEPGTYFTDQFRNRDAIIGYRARRGGIDEPGRSPHRCLLRGRRHRGILNGGVHSPS